MAFAGNQEKCKACGKTVYVMDTLVAHGAPYHKTCFKCSQCKGNLSMSTYCCSKEGVLYCKIHFDQLQKEGAKESLILAKQKSSVGSGDKQRADIVDTSKQEKCRACSKTVYVMDTLIAHGAPYHKTCFKCSQCRGNLSMSTYCCSKEGVLYCKIHFDQLQKEAAKESLILARQKSGVAGDQLRAAVVDTGGTQDKCRACDKIVYAMDTLIAHGASYHRTCFKCNQCKTNLSMSTYCCSKDGVLYCKIHFEQLQKEALTASLSKQNSSLTSGDQSKAATSASSMSSETQDKEEVL